MRERKKTREGKAYCDFHHAWEPITAFGIHESGSGSTPRFNPRCDLAEQTIADEERDRDPARTAIMGRAKTKARQLSGAFGCTITTNFVLYELNWIALIPILRALLGPEGLCLNCGRHHDDQRKWHIEHRNAPRGTTDLERQHARNLWISCGGCNTSKQKIGFDAWVPREHQKWAMDRKWSQKFGTNGWPPPDPDLPTSTVESPPYTGTWDVKVNVSNLSPGQLDIFGGSFEPA